MESTTWSGLNATVTESDEKNQALYVLYNVMIAVITISIMFSMGTSITFKGLKAILRRPIGPVIGFVCQCILLPAACFGYAIALGLADNLAIGMLMTGCCPGGTISNICSFWSKADICLRYTNLLFGKVGELLIRITVRLFPNSEFYHNGLQITCTLT